MFKFLRQYFLLTPEISIDPIGSFSVTEDRYQFVFEMKIQFKHEENTLKNRIDLKTRKNINKLQKKRTIIKINFAFAFKLDYLINWYHCLFLCSYVNNKNKIEE